MNNKELSDGIDKRFLKEFIIRALRAKALIKTAQKKNKIIIPNDLPSSGALAHSSSSLNEKTLTPSLLKSIDLGNIEVEPKNASSRVLLAPPKIPLSRVPLMNYSKHVDSTSLGYGINQPIDQSMSFVTLDKLKGELSNPALFMLECPGPDKPLITTVDGRVSLSKIRLSGDEINGFMKEVSQKTRIPVSSGLFKAVIGSYMIIAVVSEFVGTRFVIQRR